MSKKKKEQKKSDETEIKNIDTETETTEEIETESESKVGKKDSPFMKVMDVLVALICLSVIAYAGYNLVKIYQSYSEAAAIYDGLAVYVTDEDDGSEMAVEMQKAGFPYINVNFEELSNMNEDFLGWLYFPLLDISYPVVYGDTDFSYLHKAIDGTKTSSGCIFIDCASDPHLNDMTTIIYGHNMRNGSMFGSLKKIRNNEKMILEDPYFYYYTETTAYKCHVFAYYLEKSGGKTYMAPENNAGYDQYLNYVLEKNEYEGGPDTVDLKHRPKLVTLSTCSGHNTGNRTVIQAAIEDTYELDSAVVEDTFDAVLPEDEE